jgi:outer membrane murein-binding lipoprotein Lpp
MMTLSLDQAIEQVEELVAEVTDLKARVARLEKPARKPAAKKPAAKK